MTTTADRAGFIRDMTAAMATYEQAHGFVGVGEQVRVNHDACGDGRARLYIKRTVGESGALTTLGYCHNCGIGGSSRNQSIVPRVTVAKTHSDPRDTIPQDYSGRLVPAALAWMRDQYHFTTEQMDAHGVGWSDHYQRIVLPVEDRGVITGCQMRRVGDVGPKYISMRGDSPMEGLLEVGGASRTIITEDLLSAWRCADAGYNAMPLLGFHVRPERLAYLIQESNFQRWVVWLDNDKPEVIDASRYITNLINAIGGSAIQIHLVNDPKELTVEEIRQYV